jgi:hypothetical protein
VVAANVQCGDEPAPGCGVVQPSVVVTRDGVRVGITGVLSPDVLKAIPPSHAKGWKVEDPVETLKKVLPELRSKSDVVVVLSHVEGVRTAPMKTLALAEELEGWDVLAGNGLYEPSDVSRTIESLSVSGRSGVVVGTRRYSDHVSRVQVSIATDGGVTATGRVQEVAAAEDGELTERIRGWASGYCRSMNIPIGDVDFDGEWSEDDLRLFALGVMRTRTEAEVAVLNRDHVRLGDNTLSGAVTRNLVFRAFPFEDPFGVVELPGAVLQSVLSGRSELSQEKGPHVLAVLGATGTGGKFLVNGRALDPAAKYRVAMTSFLAQGGDGYFPAQSTFQEWKPEDAEEAPALRSALESWIQEQPSGKPLSPRRRFPDLSRKPLWTLGADAQVAVDTVSVSNGEDYETSGQPQLTRTPFTGQNIRAGARADLDTVALAWRNLLDVSYAQSRAEGAQAVESADRVHLNSIFHDRRFRKSGRRWAPVLYAELDIDTEITEANPFEPQPEDFRHFLTTGTAGLRSEVLPKFEVFLGGGVRSELLAPGARGQAGISAGYRLQPVTLLQGKGFKATLESSLDYFLAEPGTDRSIDRMVWTNKMSFLVFGYLTAGVALDAFAYRDQTVGPWGTSTQFTFTLGAAWSTRIQTY